MHRNEPAPSLFPREINKPKDGVWLSGEHRIRIIVKGLANFQPNLNLKLSFIHGR